MRAFASPDTAVLIVHYSNRLEALLQLLRQVLAYPPADPFVAEQIVVPHRGMARWVSQQLARYDGVTANLVFPPPASFIWQVFRAWLPDLPTQSVLDRDQLAWRIHGLLPGLLGDEAFAELSGYLAAGPAAEPRALKRWQLAGRIADVFDQYLVYRPDMILEWEAGNGDGWQPVLWRALVPEPQPNHRARLLQRLSQAFDERASPADPALLPQRVALFGISALPPAYSALLQPLSVHCEVHLFLLSPSEEYWADIVDEAGRERRRAKALRNGLPDPRELLDVGNPLLASLGHSGQAFLDQVIELDGESAELFMTPEGTSLLASLQRDILTLKDRRSTDRETRGLLAADDDSISVHACHSPLREVQVLHDRLLQWIEQSDPAAPLEPRDILVMAPDIDSYAPFIEAVFGAAPPERRIPWSIADRRLAAEQPLLAAFGELLALPRHRLTAGGVLGWLALPAVSRRFGLDADGVTRIRAWVSESGIRWGLDAEMRAALNLPRENANSWDFGLQRLFLGLALPEDTDLYHGTAPYADVEAGDAEMLGALQGFVDQLAHWRDVLGRPRPAEAWRTVLHGLIDAFFAPDDDEEALIQRLREALDALAANTAAAGFDAPLEPEIIRAEMQQVIDDSGGGHRFLTGAVTFCNMVPMRSIPARVLCLLGMNATAFPRMQRSPGFDLMQRQPRRGDRSRRADDRYLFLEALLSAREHLYLSHIGRDLRDNAVKIPSVVVDELLDYIDLSYRTETDAPPSARLRTEHPLQPFSPRCFDAADPRRWSYALEWHAAAATVAAPAGPFGDPPLPDVPPEVVELGELIRFLQDPAKWFLTNRLRLALPYEEGAVEDSEPFVLDNLQLWSLRQETLALIDRAPQAAADRLRALGLLPHGHAGELVQRQAVARAEAFAAVLRDHAGVPLEPLEVDLNLGEDTPRLRGWLDGLTAQGLVLQRFGQVRPKHLLDLWVRHLLLSALCPEGVDRVSTFVFEDKNSGPGTQQIAAVSDPLDRLRELVRLFVDAHHGPVPLFPQSSMAWAEHGAMDDVHKVWNDPEYGDRPGEGSELAVRLAFRGVAEPLDARFEEIAARVFGPLLAAWNGGHA